MVKSEHTRSSGVLLSEERAKEVSTELDLPVGQGNDVPDAPIFARRTALFSRMRLDWKTEQDRVMMQAVKQAVEERVLKNFAGVYALLTDVYDMVRTPVVDRNGEILCDRNGFTVWAKTSTGAYDEDFSRLTGKQKENIVFRITTSIFEWEEKAADAWGEAMFAKAQWEEQFAIGFDESIHGTVADRENAGKLAAREERYFAIFMALYSRKADALVRSSTLLCQRVKDSL